MSVMILLGEHLPAGWLSIGWSGSGIVYAVFMTLSAIVSGFSIVPPSSSIAMISPSGFLWWLLLILLCWHLFHWMLGLLLYLF